MDPYKGGQILGEGLFGQGAPGEYEKQIRRVGEAESAIQQARRDRSLALIDAARQEARGRITAERFQQAMAGDLGAQAELATSILGGNATMDLGQVGNFARPFYGQNTNAAQEALTLGDIPTYNKMTAASAGKDYQPVRELGGAYIADGATLGDLDDMVPTLGTQSRIATDRAQQANSYASAARTRQSMGIDAAKFGMERAGQWNPSGKSTGAGGAAGAEGLPKLSAGEAAKVRRDMKETRDALAVFRSFDQALDEVSPSSLVLGGAERGRLGTAYNNARASLRILYNTGVLQPGELPMLENALRDPTSYSAIMDPRTRQQVKAQLGELYGTITRNIENQVISYPQIYNSDQFERVRDQRRRELSAPTLGDTPAPASGGRRRYNPATGRIE